MDSEPYASLSTASEAQANPQKSTFTSSISTGSFLIRAPLTIDDDDDDLEYEGNNVIVSDSGDVITESLSSSCSDSEEFLSGEEFETASERPFMVDPNEETVEENGFVDKYPLSRPSVADSDEEFSQTSALDDGDEDDDVVDLALVDNPRVKPFAHLSMDDDGFDELFGGDERIVCEVEDASLSYVAKVPSSGIVGKVDRAPRIKLMEIEEGEEEPLSEPPSPLEFVDSLDSGIFIESWGLSTLGDASLMDNSVGNSVSAEFVEDNEDNVTPAAHFESFDDGREYRSRVVKNNIELSSVTEISAPDRIVANDRDGHEMEGRFVGVGSGSTSLYLRNDKDYLESKTKPQIDMGVYLYDPLAITSVEPIDCFHNQIRTVDSEFSEPNSTLQDGYLPATNEDDKLQDAESKFSNSSKFAKSSSVLYHNVKPEAEDDGQGRGGRQKSLLSDSEVEELVFGSSETTKLTANYLEERLSSPYLAWAKCSQEQSLRVDGQIDMDSDDEVETERNGEENELFDSATFTAPLKAASIAESEGDDHLFTSADGSRVFSLGNPAHSGSFFPSLKSALQLNVDKDVSKGNVGEEEKKRMEKIQLLRVKFLRLVQRLGHSPDDSLVAQVLYRLALTLGGHSGEAFSLESAKRVAMQCEAEGKDDLDFSLDVLVLGKTGVGKSATINSIFCEEKTTVDAFQPATTSVKVITGMIDGVKIKILDTPGLRSPVTEQSINRKILASIKKFMKKFPPDVVLYVDRLDTYTRDPNNFPLLRLLTSSLGSSVWQNAILCLTHAGSDPPDGPSGSPLSYEVFVAQQSRVIQQGISQAVGNLLLMNAHMMHPVSLVENHPSCQKNRLGESLLPNGQSWRPQLLLLCFSLKILSEVNSVSRHQDLFNHKKFLGFSRSAPLSYFLSSLLQSRTYPKLSSDQGGDEVDSDIELDDLLDSDQEDEDEYSQLPPFKPLGKSQVAELSEEQRKAYFEEYDYRLKLFEKKQWKEEVKRLKEVKKRGVRTEYDFKKEDREDEDESPATVPLILPDLVLPPSFDGDNPAYRYRYLEPTAQLLVRPVLNTYSWDHDCGYDGVSLEKTLAIANQFPGAFAVQITKDKKDLIIQLNSSISAKHGSNGSSMAGLDIQTVGKQLAYNLRGETKFRNLKINKTSAGLSITLLGENVATGLKIENQFAIGKGLVLEGNAGAVRCQDDTAYGANLELRLKDKDFPVGQDHSSLGLSLLKWRGDLTLMANLQSQFSIGLNSKMAVRLGLNHKRSGQISVKLNSSEQLQMALVGILPIAVSIFRSICLGSVGKNSTY